MGDIYQGTDTTLAKWVAYADAVQSKAKDSIATVNDAAISIQGLRSALDTSQATKRYHKPDLPQFDKDNINIWIKRAESTYVRAKVKEPKDKFWFFESIIGTKVSAQVNDFMYGMPTDARWREFPAYYARDMAVQKS